MNFIIKKYKNDNTLHKMNKEELDKIWTALKNASKEGAKQIIDNLSAETMAALRSMHNPYKKPILGSDKYKFLAFSIINMTEKYIQRFAMTSLIGFIYRMLDEYQAENFNDLPRSSFISENDPKFANIYNKKIQELLKNKPVELMNNELLKLKESHEKVDALKEMFVIRAQILKYQNYIYREELNTIKNMRDPIDKAIRNITFELKNNDDSIEPLKNKINSINANSNPKNINLTELQRSLDKKIELSKKLTEELKEKTSENLQYAIDQENLENIIKANDLSMKELKEEYNQKILKKNKSINKVKANKTHVLDEVDIKKYDPTAEELNLIAEEVKKELNIVKTAEEYDEEIQNIIQHFLDKYLRFNPDMHVQSAYKPNYADSTRTPLKNETEIERIIIPPDDTFFRWNRYIENNYECLRQATDDIYGEKSDFEFDIIPLDTFEGSTEEEAIEKFNNFKRKYADEFDYDVLLAKFMNHTLLSPWLQNREIRDFYTKNTEIIKRIIDQNKEDVRMGQKLMKERAKQKKKEDIDKYGPDPVSRKQFLKSQGKSALERHGAKHISEIETVDNIQSNDIPRDLAEVNDKELEIEVHVIKPKILEDRKSGRRRLYGYAEKFKFNIDSEPLKEGQLQIQSPQEFQQKVLNEKI